MNLKMIEYWRVDFSYDLGGIKVSDEGFWEVNGVAATAGVLVYETVDGERHKECATPEVLQNYAEGLVGKPVTNGHPPEKLTPENYKQFVVGAVLQAWYDTDTGELKVRLAINDADAQQDIDRGKVELSPGYFATVAPPPENFEFDDVDGVQISRKYNHLALVDAARGGETVRLHLDSQGNLMKDDDKKKDEEKKDGYKEKYDALKEKYDAMQAKMDAMTSKNDEDKKKDGEKDDEDKEKKDGDREDSIDRLVAQRYEDYANARRAADRFGIKVEQGESAFDIKKRIVQEKTGKLRNDSKSYVDTAFDAVCEVFPEQDSLEHLAETFRGDSKSGSEDRWGLDLDELVDPLQMYRSKN